MRLTQSAIGYIAFVNEDETELTMHAWSEGALRECKITDKPMVYAVESTGLWGEAIRQRRPVITNDYLAPALPKKGIPPGHVEITRHMNVPIFDEGRVVIVAGVGNKRTGYDEKDVRQLTLLMEGMWRTVRRKQAEDALRASEERLRMALEGTGSCIWEWIVATGKIRLDDHWTRMLGYEPHEAGLDMEWWQKSVHPESLHGFKTTLASYLAGEAKFFELEYQIVTKTGEWRWIWAGGHATERDGSGKILKMIGLHRDITEQKLAAEALRESERRLHRAEIVAHFGNWEFLLGSGEVRASEGARIIYGLEGNSWSIPEVQRLPLPEYRPILDKALKELIAEGMPYNVEFKIRRQTDGKIVDIQSIAEYAPERGVVFGVIHDISARKHIEDALRETTQRLQLAVASGQLGVWDWDVLSNVLLWNDRMHELYGVEKEAFSSCIEAWRSRLHPDDLDRVEEALRASLRGEREFDIEYRIVRPDGAVRMIKADAELIRKEDGEALRMIGLNRDITELEEIEAALKERERLFSEVFHQSPGLIVISRQTDGCFIEVNDAFVQATGYSREEAIGKTAMELNVWADLEDRRQFIAALTENGSVHNRESRFRRKSGEIFPALCSMVAMEIKGEPCLIVTIADLTERQRAEEEKKRLELQLRESHKLEAVGTLAGGIAHDFNNLLQVINGYTEMVLNDLGEAHPACSSLEEVSKAGRRAASLVRQLLAFSRRQVLSPEKLDMNEVISHLLKMVIRLIGEHIRLDFIPGHHLGALFADRGMMEQILLNLCVNARDAMVEGGSLIIETENVGINGSYCRTHPWASPGRYILISISDTGCGMDKETRDRIFEPFFTTKAQGKGTGLGLAMVYGIVKQHQGMIHAYSEPGKGTTFKVYLPVAERLASDVGTKIESAVVGGNETILLAEDEEMVRSLAARILEKAGYKVMVAEDGEDALALFRKKSSEIDLLLLDVVMPGMGGKTVYEKARELKPSIPVLFASGYTENAVHINFVLKKGFRLIQKPFGREDLLRAVREALG